jgi:DNA-binding MarR family transcriptional regulator
VSTFSNDELDRFAEAIQSLKLYRRAELESPQGEDLIEKLYVDPLPSDHVHKLLRQPNTTFLIGRKGTGKSTVFLRAQKSLLKESSVLSTYIDIKTVFESAQVDPSYSQRLAKLDGALPETALADLLLMTAFVRAVVAGIRDDLSKQLSSSWKLRVKNAVTGNYDELARGLESFLISLDHPEFVNVQGIRTITSKGTERSDSSSKSAASAKLDFKGGPSASVDFGVSTGVSHEDESAYSDVLVRTIDVRKLINGLKDLLEPLGIRHLFIFLDDFSELPLVAMRAVVDALIVPLNNWSEELVKFKIAAYPGRIYYGALDKGKLDEVSLDLHSLYGQSSIADMEMKGVDFTKRLVERRFQHFGLDASRFLDQQRSSHEVWTALFQASMGNPRALGYVLFFAYESQLLYGKSITASTVRDAAKRYYEDKIEPYFSMGRFLHESFEERSTIFSLKELLENIVTRARELRSKNSASIFGQIQGKHPTSHFNVSQEFDLLLSTLELNFFLTRYYVMSNRDGQKVSIYALNAGLCEKYSIAFGRASDSREQRLYFVERVFNYNSILQNYMASNQEIQCDTCGDLFDAGFLEALKRFNMLCPTCRVGNCKVTNISRKYEDVIRSVNSDQLLPATELGILQILNAETRALRAGDIAGELDVSYQLVGRRAKNLDEQSLVVREFVGGRREFSLTETAKLIYFESRDAANLHLSE